MDRERGKETGRVLTWERVALGFMLHAVISVTLRGRLTELEISGIGA